MPHRIKEKAAAFFSRHTSKKELFGTADGFLFEWKQDANAHAQTLTDKTVSHFRNEAAPGEANETEPGLLELSIGKLKEELKKVDNAGLIEALIIQEKNTDVGGRKGALEALEDRIKELNEQ